jgi:tetratricopeptide (TPR) repeat protein
LPAWGYGSCGCTGNLSQNSTGAEELCEAEELFSRALVIFENSELSESTRKAELLNSFALAYVGRRKYTEAEPLFEKSLEILAQASTSPRVTLQTTIRDLKMTYQILKKREKAESLDHRFSSLLRSLDE